MIERTGTGVIVTGEAKRGWPSEQPPEFLGPINSWVLDVRGNTIRDLWSERGAGTFGIFVQSGNEEVTIEGNTIDDVGRFGALGDGIRLTGPNRHLLLAGNQIGAAESESMMLRNTDAPVGGVGDWEVWVSLEAEGEDLGLDASSHLGDPAGFGMPSAIERLEVQEFGRLALVDDVDSGKRGGVGGEAEALYVSELFFQDATGLLNLNGIHLYIGELTGDPAQIVDLPFLCGNGAVDEGEECDDDNLARGDGCWNTCEVEDGFALFGAPAGGTVDIVLGGVALGIATSPGHSLLEVLEAAINSDPTLQAAEISAERVGNAIATNGDISTVDIQDDGLFSSPAAAPALGGVGLVVLAALVIAYALRNLRRTVCR